MLDQTIVAGLGNIYADECLHVARIDPRQPTGSISTSFAGYFNEARRHETYLARARLFGRQGQPCAVCGTPIERIRVAGRGTNCCPRCQRMTADINTSSNDSTD